jgi:site-specific recombinase
MKVLLALVLTLSFLTPSLVWAQAAEGEHDIVANTQNDIMLIAGAGVGGAILGLSTLSFYDKPSKNLANVWTGAALGIIAGVVIVAISHANKSQDHLTTE